MHVLEHFERICAIPRKDQLMLRNYVVSYAREHNFPYQLDSYGNLALGKGDIQLQGHLDMVCEGEHDWSKPITLVKGDEWWSAKGTSLGADNGIGVAAMLAALDAKLPVKCIFTLDEETSCGGAANCSLIDGKYLINLDNEDPTICIGSAASAVIDVDIPVRPSMDGKRIEIRGLPGGHSGADIDKNIPNAIIEVYRRAQGKIVYLHGGSAFNAIPRDAFAIVSEQGADLSVIERIPQGVIYKDTQVHTSNNLGVARTYEDRIVLTYMVRTNRHDIGDLITQIGGKVINRMPLWEPEDSQLLAAAKDAFVAYGRQPVTHVVHAGLECAYFSIPRISIGPTIENPHSPSERLHVRSVQEFWDILTDIIVRLQK